MRRFHDMDLTGAEFRECDLSRTRMVGVVMQDTEIDGLVTDLVVNGVEVMPYVEAELDRRHPVRLLTRSDRPADLQEAWRQLRDDWESTTVRVRSMPEGSEHRGVDGEWSMVETLRHLVFVHDSWFRRCVLGRTEPFTAMGLGPSFVQDQEGLGIDPADPPSLDEVLAVRRRQASEVEAWLADVTPDQLAQTAPVPDDDRWPPYAAGRTVRQCLGTVLDEEWAHHGFCARDLGRLSGQQAQAPTDALADADADGLTRTPPTLEDYLHLRATSGLSPKTAEQGAGALAGSWCWSVVRRDGRAVAMGRVIGDGGWYFHVADMATLPEHQGQGLGRRVLADLLAQVEAAAPDAYVTLMADAPGRRLYESMGFVETAPASLGMRLAP